MTSRTALRLIGGLLATTLLAAPAFAQTASTGTTGGTSPSASAPATKKVAKKAKKPVVVQAPAAPVALPHDVPGGDLFGFTSATDVGDVGSKGVGFETTTRVGKAGGGTFVVPTLKTQFAWTPIEDTQIAASPFLTGFKSHSVPDVGNKSFVGFDGLSLEASRRVLSRSESNATAVTVSTEARWSRIDGATGAGTDGRSITLKLFADRALINEKLYAAFNANLSTGTSQLRTANLAGRTEASGSDVSAALTWQFSDKLFAGTEGHWLEAFSGNFADHWQGRAFTFGPTVFYKVADNVTVNAGWQAQLAGHATGTGKPLDLTNFDRHQVRLKLAVGL